MRFHHVGYLVKKLTKAEKAFTTLGFSTLGEVVYDQYRDINILFMEKDSIKIELISPVSEKSVVANLIKKYKNSPYHMCYECDDFDKELAELESLGFCRFEEPTLAPAIENRRVCYLMNANIGLVELLER